MAGATRNGHLEHVNSTPRASPLGRVHLILDEATIREDPRVLERVARLLEAGLPSLQLRFARAAAGGAAPAGKRATAAFALEEAVESFAAARALAREGGALVLVNGPFHAAKRLEADGVHLPASGPPIGEAREVLGPGVLAGRSAHDAKELARAAGADWVFLSPLFATRSKPGAPALGVEAFARLAASAPSPVYALGGITRESLPACFAAGACGVAAISALLEAGGPAFVREAMRGG